MTDRGVATALATAAAVSSLLLAGLVRVVHAARPAAEPAPLAVVLGHAALVVAPAGPVLPRRRPGRAARDRVGS